MKFLKCLFLFAALMIGISLTAQASRVMVLKVVGSIENKSLTNRDVEASYIIDRLLYDEGAYAPLVFGTEEFASHLNRLLIEVMVRDEADVFGVAKVPEKEIDETTQSIRQKIQSHPSIKTRWAALGFTDTQLKELISRKLRANRFIKYKSNSSFVQVSDDEARDYFNKNHLKFGTMDFESFKGNIKKFLGRKNAEDRLRDWLDILRKKHKVKNLVQWHS